MNNYKELTVWLKSMASAEKGYNSTLAMPTEENYGLISQIQRCAISIPSNKAESAGSNSNREFRNFLGIANASANKLNTQLLLLIRIEYVHEKDLVDMFSPLTEIQKMIFSLIKKFSNI